MQKAEKQRPEEKDLREGGKQKAELGGKQQLTQAQGYKIRASPLSYNGNCPSGKNWTPVCYSLGSLCCRRGLPQCCTRSGAQTAPLCAITANETCRFLPLEELQTPQRQPPLAQAAGRAQGHPSCPRTPELSSPT